MAYQRMDTELDCCPKCGTATSARLTANEACQFLGTSRRTLSNWVSIGYVRAIRLGPGRKAGKLLFWRSDLEELLKRETR